MESKDQGMLNCAAHSVRELGITRLCLWRLWFHNHRFSVAKVGRGQKHWWGQDLDSVDFCEPLQSIVLVFQWCEFHLDYIIFSLKPVHFCPKPLFFCFQLFFLGHAFFPAVGCVASVFQCTAALFQLDGFISWQSFQQLVQFFDGHSNKLIVRYLGSTQGQRFWLALRQENLKQINSFLFNFIQLKIQFWHLFKKQWP